MGDDDRMAGQGRLAALFPPGWLAVQLALDAWTVSQSWRTAGMADLPEGVLAYIYALLAGAAVSLVWGLWVLALAWSRSAAFPKHFIAWQVAVIAWIVGVQAWAFIVPEFVFTAWSFLVPVAEIVIGLLAIAVAAGRPAALAYARPPGTARSPLAVALFAVLGVVAGAVVGAVGGTVIGAVIASAADVSCFEGGCGYFAAFIGLIAMLVCALAGGILAVWLSTRRGRAPG